MDVTCPSCGAAPGIGCTFAGRSVPFHTDRALAGMAYVPPAPDFDDWLDTIRAGLESSRSVVLRTRAYQALGSIELRLAADDASKREHKIGLDVVDRFAAVVVTLLGRDQAHKMVNDLGREADVARLNGDDSTATALLRMQLAIASRTGA